MITRRNFFRAVSSGISALAIAACSKINVEGDKMRYGDLLAKLAEGQTLSPAEINALRLQGNQMQGTTASIEPWMENGGMINPNLFQLHSRGFSKLPHEAAMMYRSGSQSIPNDTWTTITGYDAASGATNPQGLDIDPTTGKIYVSGLARRVGVFLYAWGTFGDTTDKDGVRRSIKLVADDTSEKPMNFPVFPVVGEQTKADVFHFRFLPSDNTYYYVQVRHDAGNAMDYGSCGFAIVRIS